MDDGGNLKYFALEHLASKWCHLNHAALGINHHLNAKTNNHLAACPSGSWRPPKCQACADVPIYFLFNHHLSTLLLSTISPFRCSIACAFFSYVFY